MRSSTSSRCSPRSTSPACSSPPTRCNQRIHARFLVERGADYLFYADNNQPKLLFAIESVPEEEWSKAYTETGKGHGRVETRTIWTAKPTEEVNFPHVAQLFRIMREVDDAKTKTARHTETVHGVTSSTAQRRALLHASRNHWQIESLHWVRDAMGEDASKVRSGSAPRVLATLRNLTIGVLRLAGVSNIAQARRHLSRRPEFALTLLGV
ncbi:MAG: ISAs1 family transposase [Acidimicrobiales bacterium]